MFKCFKCFFFKLLYDIILNAGLQSVLSEPRFQSLFPPITLDRPTQYEFQFLIKTARASKIDQVLQLELARGQRSK